MSVLLRLVLDLQRMVQHEVSAVVGQKIHTERRPRKIARRDDPASTPVTPEIQQMLPFKSLDRGGHRVGADPKKRGQTPDPRQASRQFAPGDGPAQMRRRLIDGG